MINETGLKFLQVNSPEEALGKRYTAHYHLETKAIIGVLKDFHLRGMQEKIEPLVLDIEPSLFNTLTLQINIDKIDGVMGFVRDTWKQHFPGVPLEYSFLDDDFDRVYRYEEQMGKLLRIIALLGIIIACLGLSGLAAFVSWKRQKEIGIRRVLGASTGNILTILSGKFILMVLVSIVIASPLAYLALNKWLESFAYRAPLGTDIFLVAAGVALILAFGAVAFQGLLATKRNPVESLRYE